MRRTQGQYQNSGTQIYGFELLFLNEVVSKLIIWAWGTNFPFSKYKVNQTFMQLHNFQNQRKIKQFFLMIFWQQIPDFFPTAPSLTLRQVDLPKRYIGWHHGIYPRPSRVGTILLLLCLSKVAFLVPLHRPLVVWLDEPQLKIENHLRFRICRNYYKSDGSHFVILIKILSRHSPVV